MKKIGAVSKGGGDLSVIQGTKWNDIFHGDYWEEPYPDAFNGRGGDDFLAGWGGADRLWGGSGMDTLYGGSGSDKLYGGPGNDALSGGTETDVLSGGSGADTFVFAAHPNEGDGSELDIITDFDPRQRGEHIEVLMAPDYGLSPTFSDLKSIMFEEGDDIIIDFDGWNILVLENLRIDELSANDFQIRFF